MNSTFSIIYNESFDFLFTHLIAHHNDRIGIVNGRHLFQYHIYQAGNWRGSNYDIKSIEAQFYSDMIH